MKHTIAASLLLTLAYTSPSMAENYKEISNKTYHGGEVVITCATDSKENCIQKAGETAAEGVAKQFVPVLGKAIPAAQGVYDCVKDPNLENCGKATGKVVVTIGVEAAAVPTAVAAAGALGATASTGTAIAGLSGAAATSATLAAIGAPVTAALGIAAAPAVVGAVVVGGVALGVATAVNRLFFD